MHFQRLLWSAAPVGFGPGSDVTMRAFAGIGEWQQYGSPANCPAHVVSELRYRIYCTRPPL